MHSRLAYAVTVATGTPRALVNLSMLILDKLTRNRKVIIVIIYVQYKVE